MTSSKESTEVIRVKAKNRKIDFFIGQMLEQLATAKVLLSKGYSMPAVRCRDAGMLIDV
jgi:hypothetical protein